MAEVQDAVAARLTGDATLIGLGFAAVFTRWLKRDGPGSTPSAFDPTTGRLNRSIVVLDGGENAHPSPQPGYETLLWDSLPPIYLFAEATQSGKDAVDAADRRVQELLNGWHISLPSGEQAVARVVGNRVALEDSEQFPGNVVSIRRPRITGSRRLAA